MPAGTAQALGKLPVMNADKFTSHQKFGILEEEASTPLRHPDGYAALLAHSDVSMAMVGGSAFAGCALSA